MTPYSEAELAVVLNRALPKVGPIAGRALQETVNLGGRTEDSVGALLGVLLRLSAGFGGRVEQVLNAAFEATEVKYVTAGESLALDERGPPDEVVRVPGKGPT